MRFDMARALVVRAQERRNWIGDDHGDPYEQALLSRTVPLEMEIALKEILDHLRSALDYCARQVCEACGPVPVAKSVYFPIVAHSFDAKDFPSRIGKLMPGVLGNRPDLVPVLASFQPFASDKNWWLADLATLVNETKHEWLSVNAVSKARMSVRRQDGQTLISSATTASGKSLTYKSLVLLDFPGEILGDGHLIYLCLTPIDKELLYFLEAAFSGTQAIIGTLEAAI